MPKKKSLVALGARPNRYRKDEVVRLKQLFDKCDKDASGEVSLSEVMEDLKTMKVSTTGKESFRVADLADSTFKQLDKDGSGFISFMEYLLVYFPRATLADRQMMFSWVKPDLVVKKEPDQQLTAEQLVEIADIFKLYDTNGDGSLSRAELVVALGASGYDEDECEDIFEAQAHGKHHLSMDDFIQVMRGVYL